MANQYHFITRWHVKGTAQEVYDILSEPLEYPRWWPSVYLMVREDRAHRLNLLTRGWLPYTIEWQSTTTESRRPNRIAIEAHGDFEGRGIWSIIQDGDFVDATFDWKLTAEKPLLRYLTPLLRPAFEANHRWAMEQGRKSLELELARYRSATVEEMNTVPAPAGPKNLWNGAIAAGTVLALGLIATLVGTQPAEPKAAPHPDPPPHVQR